MADVRLNGVDQLGRALENLPKVIAKKYLRRAMVAGMTPIREEARARAAVLKVPDDRRIAGALRDAIILFRDRNPGASGAAEKYYVTIRKIKLNRAQKKIISVLNRGGKTIDILGDAFYGRFIEFGHFTRQPKGGKTLRHSDRGDVNNALLAGQVQAGSVHWVPPQPFMRPAFENQKENALVEFTASLRESLPDIVQDAKA